MSKQRDVSHNSGVIFVTDLLVSVLASLMSVLFIRWQNSAVFNFQEYVLWIILVSTVASVIGFLLFKTHRVVFRHASFKSVSGLLLAVMLKEALFFVALLVFKDYFIRLGRPSMLVLTDFSFTFFVLIAYRILSLRAVSAVGESLEEEMGKINVMVYGTSPKSVAVVERYIMSSQYNVKGFITRNKYEGGQILFDHKVYYLRSEVGSIKSELGVEAILFATEKDRIAESENLVTKCLEEGIYVLTTPTVQPVNYTGLTPKAVKHILNTQFIPDGMSSMGRTIKRLLDFFISAILIVVFSPLFLIVFIAVKLDDGGPALYKQERIGLFGRPFEIYKFRSMRLDAEAAGPALYSGDDDPRLTKVGKFLRQHHLDELPQLFNVFFGDMAFVGYRPERKVFIDKIVEKDPRYAYLYQIRPGVTSYATLRNGYTDTMEKMLRRLEFDLYYLNHRSLFFDAKVLWDTFMNIAIGKKF